MILKAKVYVKNPADAPSSVKLQTGKRGGQYYLSDDIEEYKAPKQESKKPNIKIITEDSDQFIHIMEYMDDEEMIPSSPTPSEKIEKLIQDYNIDLSGRSINLLPFNMPGAFAFVLANNSDNIYLPATNDEELNNWIHDFKTILTANGYNENELQFNIDDKKTCTIIHEIGHTKVHKFINLASIDKEEEFREKEFTVFHEYVQYVHRNYNVALGVIYRKLDEMLAEDYRQIVGGNQAKIVGRYLFSSDTVNSPNYKYKQGRLDILKKMEVF